MNTERRLQFHTAALAIMGTWLLGLGQHSVTLPGVLTTVAIASLLPLDFFRALRLNRLVANGIALAAVVWSLHDFFARSSEGQLLAIADMLICLQMVLLLQEKTDRIHWQLMVLSILQVVVAAALHMGPYFALLLGVYVLVALSTLISLCMNRDWWRANKADSASSNALSADAPPWRRLLAPPQTVRVTMASQSEGRLRQSLNWQSALLATSTFVFAIVFFYCIPRLGDGAWTGPRPSMGSETGFSQQVSLDQVGPIHQNDELVMRVRFTRQVSRKHYHIIGEPYFHGIVLQHYLSEGKEHRWVSMESPPYRGRGPTKHVQHALTANDLVRQDIILENVSSPILFAVLPFQRLTDTRDDVRYLSITQRLVRAGDEDASHRREYRYAAGTIGFKNGRQLHAIPHYNAVRFPWDNDLLAAEKVRLTKFDRDQFPKLAETAEEVLREQGLESAPRLRQILALESHFHERGRYHYSLNANYVRDRRLDPIEDFVANHHTGHCELFASALALMLRSRGIPSRLIMGYKGGEYNMLGNYYQVRQKHAHAWVEAYLEPEDVPPEEVAGNMSPGGAWYRLDPTPRREHAAGEDERKDLGGQVGDAFDYIDVLWRDYVLGLNSTRQRDSLFEPLSKQVAEAPVWLEPSRFQAWLRGKEPKRHGQQNANRPLIDWQVVFFSSIVVGLSLLGVHAGLSLFPHLRWPLLYLWPWRRRKREKSGPPSFYRRLEGLLARLGLVRAVGQTPREFARVAAATLSRHLDERGDASLAELRAEVTALPGKVVEAYYHTRFGGARLDDQELAAIERALDQLVLVTRS